MPLYEITFARSARKELQGLPRTIAERILEKIDLLGRSPRPSGCRKLTGHLHLYRIRVGDYRVIYGVDDNSRFVDVTSVRHRSEAYR